MKTGSIYVYKDPNTGTPIYVGSAQDGNNMRRHRHHLSGKRPFERWLRSFSDSCPLPEHIETIEFENVKQLFEREDFWMDEFKTRASQGGLNFVTAQSAPDHAILGCIGGVAAQKTLKRKGLNFYNSEFQREMGRRGGAIGGLKGGKTTAERGHGLRFPGRAIIAGKKAQKTLREKGLNFYNSEYQREMGRRAGLLTVERKIGIFSPNYDRTAPGKIGGPKGMHIRWHVRRGVINPSCALCRGTE